ncbi:hypothetical protein NLM16_37815 [Bradyrhizobium brasilense]|uniref:hypothetical protein n=1 Tax=Bradyrhizobium brasilense TaxID=1419277 RepID=UPI0028772D3C|nr:hypothetical protein [Bradyrhizobium brasilense]MCP3419874.1 hypothetical protein [Bradyrhizobium brasilense]
MVLPIALGFIFYTANMQQAASQPSFATDFEDEAASSGVRFTRHALQHEMTKVVLSKEKVLETQCRRSWTM